MYGFRISMILGIVVVAIALISGTTIGLLSGYFGGLIDEVVMRITDIFPGIVLAITIATTLGPSLINAMIALTVTWWPLYASWFGALCSL